MPTVIPLSFIELLGQTEEAYNEEKTRLASFSTYNGVRSAIELASKGLFFRQISDEVECYYCHKTVPIFSLRQMRPLQTMNQFHLSNCEWDKPQHNVPSYIRTTVDLRNERALEYIRIRAGEINTRTSLSQEQGHRGQINEESIDRLIYNQPGSLEMAPVEECPCTQCDKPETRFCSMVLDGDHIFLTRAGYAFFGKMEQRRVSLNNVDYNTVAARMRTFENMHGLHHQSPYSLHQSERDLAEAGFFYVGPGDYVKCFKCGGGLRNLDHRSNPWREHARWCPWCEHVRREMGDRFIHQVLQTTKKIRMGHEGRELTITTDAVQNALMRGYTDETISREIQKYFRETGGYYPGAQVLIDRLEAQE